MTQGHLLGGRYQVGELLGYGGMAEVHRGRDLRLGRDVAIKTLRTDLARDATFQMRFRREAQNAAALNHPAIVAVYDTGEERGPNGEELPYIIMEFVNGRTLKEVLAAEGRLMPRRALEITADICSALEFSHRHGIIHRDIKPGNVMLTMTGQVKVMDFGIARALASGASTMTQTSAVIGTAQYLSPEQARGESVDARSDVYATGCVLFELLCGHPPFVGDNPVSVAYQHVREDPRPPSSSNRDVGPDIDAVVLKALAKNPLNRYQSAGEMRADLMRAVSGRPVSAPPVLTEDQIATMMVAEPVRPVGPPTRQVARAARRQRRKGSVVVAVLLTLLGVLAVAALGTGLWLASRKNIKVPSIVNMTVVDAEKALDGVHLTGVRRNDITSADCVKGNVVAQDPAKGTMVRENDKVQYDVCVGPNKTTVPTGLKGMTQQEAEQALRDAKLKWNFVPDDSAEEEGKVLSSDPAPGATVNEDTVVQVKVSKGNLKVIPDLNGLSERDARAALRDAGFTSSPTVVPRITDDPSEVDRVIGQDPNPNTARRPSIKITIMIGQMNNTPDSPTPSDSPTF